MTAATEARLMLLGWNLRVADVAVRERVALTADEVREALKQLAGMGIVSESVIVSTCHRSEIYGLFEGERSGEELTRFLAEWRGLALGDLSRSSFLAEGAEAARHLFRVAAGLDSMALGESEVLGQVRQALKLARESGTSRTVLHRLFESAVAAGKRVRTETEISVRPVSVASIALELAAKVFGELSQKTVLVLGAGETGGLFARQASEAGVRQLLVSSRTRERAEALARQLACEIIPWEEFSLRLASADVVVGTTASPEPIVRRADVEEAMRQRRGRPMFFLDLAVPRDVEPGIAEIYNVFSYQLNDLEEVARENRTRRSREIPHAESIVEEELSKFLVWMGNRSVVPTLADWQRRWVEQRDAELNRQPASERDRLREFADALLARLLHEPMRRLKSEPDAGKKLERLDAVRHLFDLDKDR
ncbi:MAG TPA: glutamyl-tRNA reductase [Thermoanaerobaculia bacterium]|nr:glutamyl-tRNA reductase [Thermoanaerobaculia bacterium]